MTDGGLAAGARPGASAQDAHAFLRSVMDTVRDPMLVLDTDLRVVAVNRAFLTAFRVTPEATQGRPVYELDGGRWDIPALRRLLEAVVPADTAFDGYEAQIDVPGLGRRALLLNARKLYRPGDRTEMLLLAIEDATERIQAARALRAAYERERRIAVTLQRPLSVEVPRNAFPGLSIATLYEPALRGEADVGGDFFDAFALPGGRVALAIADASGKGLAAAARVMQVKDVLRAFALEYPHIPAYILTRLNDYVCDTRQDDHDDNHEGKHETGHAGVPGFVCAAFAVLDLATGEGTLVTAGAEPPLVLRHADGGTEALELPNLPLGIEARRPYVAQPLRLGPGDALLLVTDGITEARRGDAFFGYDAAGRAAADALAANVGGAGGDVDAAAGAVLDAARAFADGTLTDDACVLLARRDP